mmetsp:Transcript_128954/g.223734  ORF Transcript_128954/g.223734 Transcript_128954/m.223734 type:complete len:426 (+) Transcript_128954:66-1343(+)
MDFAVSCPICGAQHQVQIPSGVSTVLVNCTQCHHDFQATPAAATPAQVQATPVVQAYSVPGQPVQLAVSSTRIDVSFTGAPTRSDGKREYNFALAIEGAVVHQFAACFSDLRASCKPIFGEFPSRHVFQDFNTNEANVATRAEELRSFFQRHLNQDDEGRMLSSSQVHSALGMTSQEAIQSILRVGAARKGAADAARAQVAAQRAAMEQQQLADCQLAQTFNQLVAYSSIAPGQLTTITFPRQQRFELRNRWWGWGDANIRGPGGHPWFMMQRTNPNMFGELFKNCQFSICTMRGEPLMLLQENFRWASWEYDLFRMDPRTGQGIPVCKILREWGANFMRMTDQFEVQLFPAAAAHGIVQCSGRWPNQFTLGLNGVPVASVDKQMFAFTDKYHVLLAPNIDVLLFIGIACAIDRIHHEVEDTRKR